MEDLKFIKDESGIQQDALAQLEALASAYKKYEQEIADLEADLAVKKKSFQNIAQEEIPMLLRQYGLSQVKLRDGSKITVKEDASVSVPTIKQEEFFKFLSSRNEDGIIKHLFSFKRMEPEKIRKLFEFLEESDYDFTADRNVHPQTLKKYFKELLGIGDENRTEGVASGKYLRFEDVQAIANVFVYFTTKIK